jgi:hypothetical protein
MFYFLGGLIKKAGRVVVGAVRRVGAVLKRIVKIAAPIVG